MKQQFFKFIFPVLAFFAMSQHAAAQWTGTPNNTTPTLIYNNNPTGSKVGIGITTPTQKLQVVGGNVLLDYANNTTTGNLFFGGLTYNPGGTNQNGMRLSYALPTGVNKNGYIDVRTTGGGATDGLLFRVDGNLLSNTERMRIVGTTGNVGIGTSAPSSLLHVNATAVASNAVVNISDSDGRHIFFVPKLALGGYTFASQANDAGIFWSDNSGWNSSAGFVIAPQNGIWAGIRLEKDGKATLPGYNTTVGNGISKLGLGSAYNSATSWGTSYVGFNSARDAAGNWLFNGDGGNNGGNVIYGDVAGNIRFVTKASTGGANATLSDASILQKTQMILKSDGKVMIGDYQTTMPGTYRLYVRDGILTEKVKVGLHGTANWADYVFAPDYELKPLSEVEVYVKANKHLPNVPSAEELVKNGLDLGEIQAKQMEKIEEIFLHLIALEKEVNGLKAENEALKSQK